MLKSVLMPLTHASPVKKMSRVAASLTRKTQGTLTALFVSPDPKTAVPLVAEGLSAGLIQEICTRADTENLEESSASKETFEAEMRAAGIVLDDSTNTQIATARWTAEAGLISDHVGRSGRIADISLCIKPDSDVIESDTIFNDLLFRSGKPLLAVPMCALDKASETLGKNVMIAWNGRTESARTVTSALPLLQEAESVTLLQIGETHADCPDIEAVADYLNQHGVGCTVRHEERDTNSVAEQIHTIAQSLDCDLLVLGAYSHARWKELVLGGVTNWLMSNSRIPMFMCH